MNIKIQFDVSKLAQQLEQFKDEIKEDLNKAVKDLATITEAKTREEASSELHSSYNIYDSNLTSEEIAPGIWVVSLDEPALWIEEGIPPNKDMKPDLLKDAQTSATGHRYKVIPFNHSKSPSQTAPSAQRIVNDIKQNLKKQKVNIKKIEYNANGSPKLGKLHQFDFGGHIPGKGNTPSMKGLSIYQSMSKSGNVRRDILTFRTVSDGPGSEGKWIHPGYTAKKFMDKAAEYAMHVWETQILDEILAKWK